LLFSRSVLKLHSWRSVDHRYMGSYNRISWHGIHESIATVHYFGFLSVEGAGCHDGAVFCTGSLAPHLRYSAPVRGRMVGRGV